jgi:hypothetical protein
MIDFIVSEIERKEFIMSKEELSDHHRAIRLDLVPAQV